MPSGRRYGRPESGKMQKNQQFYWKFLLFGVILCNCFIGTECCIHASEAKSDDGSIAGATVRILPEDAQRQQYLNQLKRECSEAKAALAALQAENDSLRRRVASGRRELLEVTEKYQVQNEQFRSLRLFLSGAQASGEVRSTGEREEQLLRLCEGMAKDGRALALRAVEFCEQMDRMIQDLPIGKVEQTRIRLRLETLQESARKFIVRTGSGGASEPLEKCRILAVDRDLAIVILPVGSDQGAFIGLTYYVGKEEPVVLRVVGVRPNVAAARPVSGSIDELAPGMEAATQKNQAKPASVSTPETGK